MFLFLFLNFWIFIIKLRGRNSYTASLYGQRTNEHCSYHEYDTIYKEIYFRESAAVTASYLVHHDTLLQNLIDIITKRDSYFITSYVKSILQNASKSLLQNAAVTTIWDDFITKCESYYKTWRLLQNSSVQTLSLH